MSVTQSLTTFVDHYLKTSGQRFTPYDPAWRSPCETGDPFANKDQDEDGTRPAQLVRWDPVERHNVDDFGGLEKALGAQIHTDIKEYFGCFWSAGIEAEAPDGHVSLILLWNPADADRLIENLIGHSLAQRQCGSPFSVFFACTENDSELFLSVQNDSGQVVLEKPGYKPIRTVSNSLAQFIDSLTPVHPTT